MNFDGFVQNTLPDVSNRHLPTPAPEEEEKPNTPPGDREDSDEDPNEPTDDRHAH